MSNKHNDDLIELAKDWLYEREMTIEDVEKDSRGYYIITNGQRQYLPAELQELQTLIN